MKWGLVAAGLADMNRPVENVSVPQCTGKSKSDIHSTQLNSIEQVDEERHPKGIHQLTHMFTVLFNISSTLFSLGSDRCDME